MKKKLCLLMAICSVTLLTLTGCKATENIVDDVTPTKAVTVVPTMDPTMNPTMNPTTAP